MHNKQTAVNKSQIFSVTHLMVAIHHANGSKSSRATALRRWSRGRSVKWDLNGVFPFRLSCKFQVKMYAKVLRRNGNLVDKERWQLATLQLQLNKLS